jgi:hypothetical protein
VSNHLAGLADIAKLLGKLQKTNLGPNHFLLFRHARILIRRGGLLCNPASSATRLGFPYCRGPRTKNPLATCFGQRIALQGKVLVYGRNAGISDQHRFRRGVIGNGHR